MAALSKSTLLKSPTKRPTRAGAPTEKNVFGGRASSFTFGPSGHAGPTKQRLSGFSHARQCGDKVLRILVTGGPPNFGGGGMPHLIKVVRCRHFAQQAADSRERRLASAVGYRRSGSRPGRALQWRLRGVKCRSWWHYVSSFPRVGRVIRCV